MKRNMESDAVGGVTTLHIKNMVCDRCIAAVRRTLSGEGLEVRSVELGLAVVAGRLGDDRRAEVARALAEQGFELIGDAGLQTVERMKSLIVELVHYGSGLPNVNLSTFLSEKLNADYGSLSKLFSATTGTTVEKYFIAQKIEMAKELLSYGELTLSEIAYKLNYSSTAYLSSQFKSVTGMTPSRFKAEGFRGRKPLDKV